MQSMCESSYFLVLQNSQMAKNTNIHTSALFSLRTLSFDQTVLCTPFFSLYAVLKGNTHHMGGLLLNDSVEL